MNHTEWKVITNVLFNYFCRFHLSQSFEYLSFFHLQRLRSVGRRATRLYRTRSEACTREALPQKLWTTIFSFQGGIDLTARQVSFGKTPNHVFIQLFAKPAF